VKAYFY